MCPPWASINVFEIVRPRPSPPNRRVISLCPCSNASFFRGELDAVLNQVPKNLLQTCRVAFHVRMNGTKSKVHFEVLCLDFVTADLVSALQDLVNGNRLEA